MPWRGSRTNLPEVREGMADTLRLNRTAESLASDLPRKLSGASVTLEPSSRRGAALSDHGTALAATPDGPFWPMWAIGDNVRPIGA